jgi:hypothetical protein
MLRNIIGRLRGLLPKKSTLRSYYEDTSDLPEKEYHKVGTLPIPTEKIVGSVDRAHELDSQFHYIGRRVTGRFKRVDAAMREGKPQEPIKVLKVKRDKRETQYYVADGHHRVASAKAHHFDQINADITEVIARENEDSESSA